MNEARRRRRAALTLELDFEEHPPDFLVSSHEFLSNGLLAGPRSPPVAPQPSLSNQGLTSYAHAIRLNSKGRHVKVSGHSESLARAHARRTE